MKVSRTVLSRGRGGAGFSALGAGFSALGAGFSALLLAAGGAGCGGGSAAPSTLGEGAETSGGDGLGGRPVPPAATSPATVLAAARDTTVLPGRFADRNFGASPFLQIDQALIAFDSAALASAVAGNLDVTSARLEVTVTRAPRKTFGRGVQAFRMTHDWSELAATFDCAADRSPGSGRENCPRGQSWNMGPGFPVQSLGDARDRVSADPPRGLDAHLRRDRRRARVPGREQAELRLDLEGERSRPRLPDRSRRARVGQSAAAAHLHTLQVGVRRLRPRSRQRLRAVARLGRLLRRVRRVLRRPEPVHRRLLRRERLPARSDRRRRELRRRRRLTSGDHRHRGGGVAGQYRLPRRGAVTPLTGSHGEFPV